MERVRLVVAECIGRLFTTFPSEIGDDLCTAMEDADNVKVSTLARSFLFSGKSINISDDFAAQEAW